MAQQSAATFGLQIELNQARKRIAELTVQNANMQENLNDLEAQLAELRGAAQTVVKTWPFTTDTEIDGLAALLPEEGN